MELAERNAAKSAERMLKHTLNLQQRCQNGLGLQRVTKSRLLKQMPHNDNPGQRVHTLNLPRKRQNGFGLQRVTTNDNLGRRVHMLNLPRKRQNGLGLQRVTENIPDQKNYGKHNQCNGTGFSSVHSTAPCSALSAQTVPATLVSPFPLMIPSANIASIFGPPLDGPNDDNSTCFSAPSCRPKSPNSRWQPREEDSEPLRERYVTPRFHLGKALLEYGRVAILKYSDPEFGTVD